MALDLSGIVNVGEFFSQHYLEALLESDLKQTFGAWSQAEKDGGPKAPPKRLAALAERYFKAVSRATGEGDSAVRLELAQDFHAHLLDALGYTRAPAVEPLGDDSAVPVALSITQQQRPYLWVVEAPFAASDDDADPFAELPLREQLPEALRDDTDLKLPEASWAELFDGDLFRSEHPPRWVLFLAGGDVFLLDRNKWPQGRYLHFQLGRLFGLRDPQALRAVAGLLHHRVLVPESGQSLLETLDENSHKHAFAVSTDLKFGAQQAIELLGNEAIHYKRTTSKEGVFNNEELARELTRECVTYLYRMLFLFYVEARGAELGVVPMGSDAYREGYSLETLRELELVPLTTPEARDGYYLDASLRRLFHIVQRGHGKEQLALGYGEPIHETFLLPGLRSALFDEARTPLLRGVKFRNFVLQEVLQLLSLSREGRGKERGRISYAQLGINQLGAVYEGLLSYTGFFAAEELYEVRAANEVHDPSARTYFVPASRIDQYKDEEKVRDGRGLPVRYAKGTYLFRLSGRDRERSASYYTPEVLTACLTKYTLKERLGEPGKDGALSADEILELTVCEPAMGSGAFLNEAVNQLAHAYLERKQAELGRQIPADQYQEEWARVKYHFVVHNCYGVDLNPLAAELGKVSLWLNVLGRNLEAPYLDLRIGVGNSLIGARREVFEAGSLLARAGRGSGSYLDSVPQRVPLGTARPAGSVYHFLVPDAGMVPYAEDKVAAELKPTEAETLRAWRKALCQPYTEAEVARLAHLSDRIDALWAQHAAVRVELLAELRQPVPLWGQPPPGTNTRYKSVEESEELARRLFRPGAPGERLAAVMDYWGACWFWPLVHAKRAPSRTVWLDDLERLLEGGMDALEKSGAEAKARLDVVRETAQKRRFFHWELRFAEVFAQRGGMDLILGNPPWIKVEWQESGVLGDIDPTLNLRKLSAKQVAERRGAALADSPAAVQYLDELESTTATQTYLSSVQNYHLLQGQKANLYKCFMVRSWSTANSTGNLGLLQQTGIFDDPRGGDLRAQVYRRLRWYAQFVNEGNLFPEIHNRITFAITTFGAPGKNPGFRYVCGLFQPHTIDSSVQHDGAGAIPAIKNDADEWDVRGHRSRIVPIDERALQLFAQLYDPPGTPPLQARLPMVHSREILDVLIRFAQAERRLSDLGDEYFCTQHFNETLQQQDGTIRRETRFPKEAQEWVVSGPHFYVGTPFNKTPNEGCRHNKDYSPIDLTLIPDDYLPRTNYVPACPPAEYLSRTPHWRGRPVTELYRYVNRRMIAPTGERTLTPALIPPGPAHVDLVFSVSFASPHAMVAFAGMASSVPIDFFVKSTGKGDARNDLLAQLPLPSDACTTYITRRALRLNCLTTHYAALWQDVADPDIANDAFAKADPRLPSWSHLTPTWTRDSALRTPYERRQALVELDALAALSLGLTLEQLLLIYRVQFPVLQQYEKETFYDQRGKIVFTTNRGLSGVGLDRKQWEQVKEAHAGDALPEWARDGQGPFVPPFDRCDREPDMAEAYRHFERLLGKGS